MDNDMKSLEFFFVIWMLVSIATMILVAVLVNKITIMNDNFRLMNKMINSNLKQQNPIESKKRICLNCKKENDANATFCIECGAKLN